MWKVVWNIKKEWFILIRFYKFFGLLSIAFGQLPLINMVINNGRIFYQIQIYIFPGRFPSGNCGILAHIVGIWNAKVVIKPMV